MYPESLSLDVFGWFKVCDVAVVAAFQNSKYWSKVCIHKRPTDFKAEVATAQLDSVKPATKPNIKSVSLKPDSFCVKTIILL